MGIFIGNIRVEEIRVASARFAAADRRSERAVVDIGEARL